MPPELEPVIQKSAFPFQEQLLIGIRAGVISVNNLPKELFDYTFFNLTDQIAFSLDTNSELFAKMADNIAKFSANKTFQEVYTIEALKGDPAIVSDAAFMESATIIDNMFNKNWLAVEKDAAFKMGVSAREWQNVEAFKDDLPLLEYSTVGDSRVRDEHVAEDGKTYPVDHPYWDTWYPPNGWRCRCEAVQVRSGRVSNGEFERNDDSVFGMNPGKTGQAFKETHPYFEVPKRFTKAQKNNFDLA